MHRDYDDERNYRRSWRTREPDDDMELWGRQMDRDDWERGTYGGRMPMMHYGRGYQGEGRQGWSRRDRGYGRASTYDDDWNRGPTWDREGGTARRGSGNSWRNRHDMEQEPRWEYGRDWGYGVRTPDWDRPMDYGRYDTGGSRWDYSDDRTRDRGGTDRHWHGRTGMRGYQRSDERIREEVCDRLTDHPGIDTGDMEISVSGGEVTLTGMVDGRWEKRMAEDLAEQVPGVRDVQNRLRIASSATQDVEVEPGTTRISPASSAGRGTMSRTRVTNGTAGASTTTR